MDYALANGLVKDSGAVSVFDLGGLFFVRVNALADFLYRGLEPALYCYVPFVSLFVGQNALFLLFDVSHYNSKN